MHVRCDVSHTPSGTLRGVAALASLGPVSWFMDVIGSATSACRAGAELTALACLRMFGRCRVLRLCSAKVRSLQPAGTCAQARLRQCFCFTLLTYHDLGYSWPRRMRRVHVHKLVGEHTQTSTRHDTRHSGEKKGRTQRTPDNRDTLVLKTHAPGALHERWLTQPALSRPTYPAAHAPRCTTDNRLPSGTQLQAPNAISSTGGTCTLPLPMHSSCDTSPLTARKFRWYSV